MPSEYHELLIKYGEYHIGSDLNIFHRRFARKHFKDSLIRLGFTERGFVECFNFIPDSYLVTEKRIIIIEANASNKVTADKWRKIAQLLKFFFLLDFHYPEVELKCFYIDDSFQIKEIDLRELYFLNMGKGQYAKPKKLHSVTRKKMVKMEVP